MCAACTVWWWCWLQINAPNHGICYAKNGSIDSNVCVCVCDAGWLVAGGSHWIVQNAHNAQFLNKWHSNNNNNNCEFTFSLFSMWHVRIFLVCPARCSILCVKFVPLQHSRANNAVLYINGMCEKEIHAYLGHLLLCNYCTCLFDSLHLCMLYFYIICVCMGLHLPINC